jgi:NAD(P)-dependent dehydrogenase (short-subunit alcohol dehydrogenase family)
MGYFSDRIALVTGGASGIGEALVRGLAEQGARVIIADYNFVRAEQLATELCAHGHAASASMLDIRERQSIEYVIGQVVKRYKRLDIMVNNVGVLVVSEVADTEDSDWDRLIEVNLKGVFHGYRAALGQMRLQGFGQILNTASAAALAPMPYFGAYGAIKHAVLGMTTAARIEAAMYNIKVCALCPGVVDTPILSNHVSHGVDSDKLFRLIPFKQQPAQVARAALKGLKQNRAVITVGLSGQLPYWAYRWFPDTYCRLVSASHWATRRFLVT